ncbi:MAG: S8 family serine peptidase [Cytophagales bacterium]|nr:S8 family serine peptidase [Cytophagales bacterium]
MSRVLRIVFFCATVLWGVEIQAQWKALESDRLHVSDKDEALGKGSSKALQLLSLSGGQNLRAEGFFSNGFLKGFIDLHEGFPDSFLAQHQIEVLSEVGAFRSVRFPAHRLREILQSDWVRYLDVDFPIKPKLDRVREAVRVTQVHEGTGLSRSYKGEGVVVGVVDFGFDLTHPAFQDQEGNLRIKRVWDQSSTSGMPPVGYEYGEELSNAEQILGKRYTSAVTTHGTHVAGIAAGSGRGLSEYEGVAPMADLVLVQLHGGISSVAEAVSYIFSYAESVQKPAVVNLSLGTHIGPHDGMSMLDQVFDDLAGMGKIIIGAVGNEGDVPLHLQYDSDGIQESLQTFVFFEESEENTGNGYLNVWGQSGQEVRLAVKLFDEQGELLEHTPFVSTAGDAQLDTVFSTRVPGVNVRIVSESANPYNQKPNLLVWIENAYPQVFPSIELRAAAGAVHVWNDGQGDGAPLSDRLPGSTPVVGWVAGDTEYTIGEIGGTGRSVISAGAFCTKTASGIFMMNSGVFRRLWENGLFFPARGRL